MNNKDRERCIQQLRANLRARAPELLELLQSVSGREYEDPVYRFYHQSFKIFPLQDQTGEIVKVLQSLLPDQPMNEWFLQIVREGTGKKFSENTNTRWLSATRPIVEAFFHARFFLEMACRYCDRSEEDVNSLASGWAAFLYLFQLR